MSWLSSLFTGNNSSLNSALSNTGQLAGTAAGLGTNNATQGSGFFSSILSGDPTKIATALAPAISAGQQGAQQQKNSTAQFGNRSGGTNASMQAIDAATRGNITNLVGGAQTGAASSLLSSGSGLLGTALSGYGQQGQLATQQVQGWQQSLFGGALTGAAGLGLGVLGKDLGLKAPSPTFNFS